MLVVDKKGKVSTIDKKDWSKYKKGGYTVAESIGENREPVDEYVVPVARGVFAAGKALKKPITRAITSKSAKTLAKKAGKEAVRQGAYVATDKAIQTGVNKINNKINNKNN